jgi:hypothetical protein
MDLLGLVGGSAGVLALAGSLVALARTRVEGDARRAVAREEGAAAIVPGLLERLELVESRAERAEERSAECERLHEETAARHAREREADREACAAEIGALREQYDRDFARLAASLMRVLPPAHRAEAQAIATRTTPPPTRSES